MTSGPWRYVSASASFAPVSATLPLFTRWTPYVLARSEGDMAKKQYGFLISDELAAGLKALKERDGIPESETEQMLQPFTRLDDARGGPGTGLGLAIVDRIARAHRGSVRH